MLPDQCMDSGSVNDNGAGLRIAVIGIKAHQTPRAAMLFLIDVTGEIRSLRGGCQSGQIGETFNPAAMIRI